MRLKYKPLKKLSELWKVHRPQPCSPTCSLPSFIIDNRILYFSVEGIIQSRGTLKLNIIIIKIGYSV
ncbi:hypothetical protein GUJ93_ZPchr0012g20524 [Zizania palustris]|uniref:Uncharacterized protein n=1 Tax=Zizania palustris TaxID=103762 RepID=A0A8J5WTY9_ZIZPA|nr:hypothetical protein GUJ93_ZPchr0012g20524 [Zizania palustris]